MTLFNKKPPPIIIPQTYHKPPYDTPIEKDYGSELLKVEDSCKLNDWVEYKQEIITHMLTIQVFTD